MSAVMAFCAAISRKKPQIDYSILKIHGYIKNDARFYKNLFLTAIGRGVVLSTGYNHRLFQLLVGVFLESVLEILIEWLQVMSEFSG